MADPLPLFKFSHAGEVFLEGLTLAQAIRQIGEKKILPTDHYWSDGMTEWKLVSSRTWILPPEAVKAPAPQSVTPKPMPTPGPSQASMPFTPKPTPMPSASATKSYPSSVPSIADAPEKGFSPYVTFYRSNDDRWAYGIFGGLAHRNCWTSSQLTFVRLTTLVFVFPALAYLVGWGFFVLFMVPSLPTKGVRSYFDLNQGLPSQDSQDISKIVKIVLFGFALLFALIVVLRMFGD